MKLRNFLGEIKKSVLRDLNEYIDENYSGETHVDENSTDAKAAEEVPAAKKEESGPAKGGSEFVRYCIDVTEIASEVYAEIRKNAENGFSRTLKRTIDASGKTDAEVYNKAGISRQLFNKIKNNLWYHPEKKTVLSLICALEPDYDTCVEMLKSAGYAFSNGSKFDIIVEYCIKNKIYKIADINDILHQFEQPLLGSTEK